MAARITTNITAFRARNVTQGAQNVFVEREHDGDVIHGQKFGGTWLRGGKHAIVPVGQFPPGGVSSGRSSRIRRIASSRSAR